jgi:hypothetical protein
MMDRPPHRTIIYPNQRQKKERMTLMTSTSRPRLKILERAPGDRLPPLRMTARDFDIIHAVYKYRVLSTSQIEALLFQPSPGRTYSRKKRCQTRLKLLFHHSWLFRNLPYAKPYALKHDLLYTLDRRGIERLAVELDQKPKQVAKRSSPRLASASYQFLKHTLMVNELQILLDLGAQCQRYEIKEWRDELALRQYQDKVTITGPRGGKQAVAVTPDLYNWLTTGEKDFHHFIEADMKTVVIDYDKDEGRDWARKVRAYIEYYDSGMYQKRYPAAGKSMRVLVVTLGQGRLENMLEATEKVAGKRKNRFWFTSLDRLTPDTILTEPIWRIAGRDELHQLIW